MMIRTVALIGFALTVEAASLVATEQPTLPDPARIAVARIAETHRVLDQVAAAVWPGWTGTATYAQLPTLVGDTCPRCMTSGPGGGPGTSRNS